MSKTIQVSIVIIVKNDKGVFQTIDTLQKIIEFKSTEVIVVDGSVPLLIESNKSTYKIKWIPFTNKSNRKITIPEQRNSGVKIASGSIIVFIDANCIPKTNWLYELIAPIVEGKEYIVAGSILSSTKNKRHDIRNKLLHDKEYLDEAPTMNLAVHKKVFEKIGYFDETFDYGSDVDFTLRATEEGYKIRYNPKAIIYHNWGSFKDEVKRAFRYGEARVNIYRKHKKSILTIFRKDPLTIIYPTFILLLPITFIFPGILILLLIPIIKNWRHYPIKTTILNLTYGSGILYKLLHSL